MPGRMTFVVVAVAAALVSTTAGAMDAATLRAIAEKPHSRENLISGLKIYPDAREYDIIERHGAPGEELKASPIVKATEKVVEGKYVVSSYTPDGAPGPILMVVTYNSKEKAYRKWLVMPDDSVAESIGTAIPKRRAVAWGPVPTDDDDSSYLGIEFHTDTATTWRNLILEDGKVRHISEGRAKKTK